MTKKTFLLSLVSATALTAGLPAAASAAQAGDIQIKAFATGVLPDGDITNVDVDTLGLPVTADTSASDSVVPTIAIEYFLTNNLSVETICCVTPHNVNGTGALAGARLVDDAIILPATVLLKLHFDIGDTIKPYVGAGPAHFFIFSEGVGADAAALGVTDVGLSNEFGFALQAGVDIPLNSSGLGFSLDAKRYFVDTTATFRAGNSIALQTEHSLDPWVVSGGLSYRF